MKMKQKPLKLFSVSIVLLILLGTLGAWSVVAAVQSVSNWTAPEEAKEVENIVEANADSIKKGKDTYGLACAMCHGSEGAGDGPMSADMEPKPSVLSKDTIGNESDGELFWKISNGKAPMMSFEAMLPEEDRWNVVNFIRTF